MRRVAIASALLLLAAAPAFAEFQPTVGVVPLQAGPAADPAFVCLLGNAFAGAAAGYYNYYQAGESYALLIDPAQCSVCPVGFNTVRVRMLLRLDAGANFQVACGIDAAVEASPGCWVPGPAEDTSVTYGVSGVTTPGGYYINLPYVSPCALSTEKYFLTWTMVGGTGVLGPYIDNNGATACLAYNNRGAGWTDLSTSFIGDIFLWAEVDCCNVPVPADPSTWGAVKGLYR